MRNHVKVKRTLTKVLNPKFNIYSKFFFSFVCPVFKSLLQKWSSTFGEFSFTFWSPPLTTQAQPCLLKSLPVQLNRFQFYWAFKLVSVAKSLHHNILGSLLSEGWAPVSPFRTVSTRFSTGRGGWERGQEAHQSYTFPSTFSPSAAPPGRGWHQSYEETPC